MVANRLLLVLVLVFAVFTGYALGQKNAIPVPANPAGPVFSGGDLGFQVSVPLSDIPQSAPAVTGRFVVRVNGRWVEARVSAQHGVVPLR